MPASTVVVGKTQIIGVTDALMQFPWTVFLAATVARSEIDAYKADYPGSFAGENFGTRAGGYVIHSEGKTILCDTGVGPGPHAWLGGLTGNLVPDMESKGISPSEIDFVVFTHLHGDHVGWNLTGQGKPTFPNARYVVPQADWDFFNQNTASNPQMQLVTPLQDMGLLDLVSGEKAITSEVTTYPTPGHTPGHQSLLVTSDGERSVITGDVAHFPAQVEHIDWPTNFETDNAAAIETRRKMFAQLEEDGVISAFCHFPEAPFGRLIRSEGKRMWKAIG
ncbi:MAG TPA: MBL fold metallo-hydrolase [Dehalococcoidia bacterium]|nr:MBL fold metallo-hydrolase [Dehalococcoidia bacterium]